MQDFYEVPVPTIEEMNKGICAFRKYEPRDSVYTVATFIISTFFEISNLWKFDKQKTAGAIADGVGVLLLIWNQAFYQYGEFDANELRNCIERNWEDIVSYRNRTITSIQKWDKGKIERLFNDFLDALKIPSINDKKERKSPVAVAKALHSLLKLIDEYNYSKYTRHWI